MNNSLHKYNSIKSSKNNKNILKVSLMLYPNKKEKITNFKNIFMNRDLNNSKFKTKKNSRKYLIIIIFKYFSQKNI